MVVRGRLAFDDQGRLVEIAEDAQDPTNPQPSEIDPVEFEDLIAQTAAVQNLDAGQLVSALDANDFDINDIGLMSASEISVSNIGCRVGLSNQQSIPSQTITKVQYDDEQYDDAGEFDTSTYEFTANSTGVYLVSAQANFLFPPDGTQMQIRIYVNGSSRSRYYTPAGSSSQQTIENTEYIRLSQGDVVDIRVWHDDSSALDLNNTSMVSISQLG